ncbi:hypothetical protein DDW44_25160 [Streptomyces tirandamycinicus]|uniref:Uncharacterized protein n=1 Tax=Streptomyces tirandamycinicus TaxID=2174846 RepID=A0A2S1SZ63_9ACTN|nr:hypothetical protein DDW44_25160 [Streptomyces tirandamycinicus]
MARPQSPVPSPESPVPSPESPVRSLRSRVRGTGVRAPGVRRAACGLRCAVCGVRTVACGVCRALCRVLCGGMRQSGGCGRLPHVCHGRSRSVVVDWTAPDTTPYAASQQAHPNAVSPRKDE